MSDENYNANSPVLSFGGSITVSTSTAAPTCLRIGTTGYPTDWRHGGRRGILEGSCAK